MLERPHRRVVSGAAPVILGLVLWEATCWWTESVFVPPPSMVFLELGRLVASGALLRHLLASLFRVSIGLTIGAGCGVTVGLAMGHSARVRAVLRPMISLLCPIPALGWLPLLMVWVGVGELLPILVIVICSFFPICYNTANGIETVDPRLLRAARTLGASELRALLTVALPTALPEIFTGLRLEAGMAWRVIIAAEMVAIPSGVGALMMEAESVLRVDTILVALLVLSFMCFVFERILVFAERRVTGQVRSPCAKSNSSISATTPAAD